MYRYLLFFLLCFVTHGSFAQFESKPSRSRFFNNKLSAFPIGSGDILVYNLSKNDTSLPFVAYITWFDSVIAFNYAIPGQNENRDLMVRATAVLGATKYDSVYGSKAVLKDESMLWLSQKNFRDLFYDRVTRMDMGNGEEYFVRRRTSTWKLNFKGQEKIFTVYNIENYSKNPKIRFAVLTNNKNPLIVKFDAGLNFDLKEVR